jgi:hypothetical protein
VAWPRYQPRWPPGTSGARLERPGLEPVLSVPLDDVNALAEASLSDRRAGLLVKESAKTVAQEVLLSSLDDSDWEVELFGRLLLSLADTADLRHWSSLPASMEVLRAPLDAGTSTCTLVYETADAREIDREVLELPPEWTDGPLFVTRRMP